jgi:hypothetical protein
MRWSVRSFSSGLFNLVPFITTVATNWVRTYHLPLPCAFDGVPKKISDGRFVTTNEPSCLSVSEKVLYFVGNSGRGNELGVARLLTVYEEGSIFQVPTRLVFEILLEAPDSECAIANRMTANTADFNPLRFLLI